jgi:hypothetical protein
LKPGQIKETIKRKKNMMWPDWPNKIRSKTRLQPVDFCFFTKTISFWL